MSYEYITSYDSPNYTSGRQGCSIDKIIVHWWGDPNLGMTFQSVVNTLCSSSRQASAHYVLEAGKVACIVDLNNTAWHAGNWNANLTSIGIECNPRCWDGDVETLCELIADLWKTYGVLPIYGHKDFHATACPGTYYNYITSGYLYNRAMEIYKGTSEEEEETMTNEEKNALAWAVKMYKKANKKNPSDWAKEDLTEAVKEGITTGERPQDVATREEVAIMMLRAKKKND